MLDRLGPQLGDAEAALAAAVAAPLSIRKAWLAAMLADGSADRLFADLGDGGDIIAFRAGLAAASPALALVFGLCAMREGGPKLVVESVEVPVAEYHRLDVADFMVSLYNGHRVERVRIALADGSRHDVHAVLGEAISALRQVVAGREAAASTG